VGQKTHPFGFRLGFNKQWSSRWFSKGAEYSRLIHEDLKMKKLIKERYYHAGISEVGIERVGPKVRIIIHTARPGIVIGRGGKEIENLKSILQDIVKKEVYKGHEESSGYGVENGSKRDKSDVFRQVGRS
jgi:small subunit ribosomal protein S3